MSTRQDGCTPNRGAGVRSAGGRLRDRRLVMYTLISQALVRRHHALPTRAVVETFFVPAGNVGLTLREQPTRYGPSHSLFSPTPRTTETTSLQEFDCYPSC